jgi:hypothetical protein
LLLLFCSCLSCCCRGSIKAFLDAIFERRCIRVAVPFCCCCFAYGQRRQPHEVVDVVTE